MKTTFSLVTNKKEVIALLRDFNVDFKIKGDKIVADTMDEYVINLVDELILTQADNYLARIKVEVRNRRKCK